MSEKRKSSISIGPGASSLILIFVVLSMSVLGILTLMVSRNDLKLSQRGAEVIEAVYQLEERAEETRARIDELVCACREQTDSEDAFFALLEAQLPAEWTLEEHLVCWQETDDSRELNCAVEVFREGQERTRWARHRLTTYILETGGFEEEWD